MKQHLITRSIALFGASLLLTAASLQAADWTRYTAKPGSSVDISGTSTIHDWTVTTKLIGGFMELGPNFPLDPSQKAKVGKVDAKCETVILVGAVKSGKKAMDEVMYDTMNQKKFPKITFKLQEISLKEEPKAGSPLVFDSKGVINVSGVSKTNAMVITMEPKDAGKIIIKGNTKLKMTDFGMKPPAPSVGLGLIKTGDDVDIKFEWVTAKAKAK
jgi:polyisoprenoid-binding protein YceI